MFQSTGSPRTLLQLVLLMGTLLGSLIELKGQGEDFSLTYSPIQSTGFIPERALATVAELTALDVSLDSSSLSAAQQSDFYALSNYALVEVLRSGYVYFEGPLTDYLEQIVDTLLVDEPELRKRIRVYPTRIGIPNANAWRDGTILFNLNLLHYLNSEAELAFILAHEIAHIRRFHSLSQYKQLQETKESYFDKGAELEGVLRVLRFSREQESEADSLGLELIRTSSYPAHNALSALKSLEVIGRIKPPLTASPLNVEALFEDVDSLSLRKCGCSTVGLVMDFQNAPAAGTEEEIVEEDEILETTKSAGKKGVAKSAKRDSLTEENFSTHPSLESRIENLGATLTVTDSIGKTSLVGESVFARMKLLMSFEYISQKYQSGKYISAFYQCMRLEETFPNNAYLSMMASRSLYQRCFHALRNLTGELDKEEFLLDRSQKNLACFLWRLSDEELVTLTRAFLYREAKKHPEEGEYWVLLGQLAEMEEEVEQAKELYKRYEASFAQGPFLDFVRYRLQAINHE